MSSAGELWRAVTSMAGGRASSPSTVRRKDVVRMKSGSYVALALTAVIGLTGCATDADRTDPKAGQSSSTPGPDSSSMRDETSMPPWPAPTDTAARVAAAGLDLGPMGTAEHYHPRLRIVIGGVDVPVPPGIGVDPSTGAMSALHTHEGDGTIHIEADTVREVFTLGQLFTQWGVALTSQQIGGVRANPGQQVRLTSNGAEVTGDPADLRLEPDQQILLTLG